MCAVCRAGLSEAGRGLARVDATVGTITSPAAARSPGRDGTALDVAGAAALLQVAASRTALPLVSRR